MNLQTYRLQKERKQGMGLFRKKVFKHIWKKKGTDILALEEALEREVPCTNNVFKNISKTYLKCDKRGVSNLYLIKEVSDGGVVCALYAFPITNRSIRAKILSAIRDVAKNNLSVSEMRACSYGKKSNAWCEEDVRAAITRVEEGNQYGVMDYLIAKLSPQGIILTARQVRKEKFAYELECSAVAWGIKTRGLRKGVTNRLIHNECLND